MRGSAPGERRGGRQKGVPNRRTAEREADIAASGLTPLDFMLDILRDTTRPDADRLEAAKQAAPYCHAKLAAVAVDLDVGSDLAAIIAERRAKVAAIGD